MTSSRTKTCAALCWKCPIPSWGQNGLAGEPADDGRFVAGFAHALEHAGGYAPEDASRVAGKLLPDILSYDPTRPACFPSNGRTLTDDAGDAFLAVLTNGKIVEDKVEAHRDLLAEFPYLG